MSPSIVDTKPWLKFYDNIPATIDYPQVSLYERLMQTVQKYPNATAWEFMGTEYTYKKFGEEVDRFANGLAAIGFKKGDVITISMPTAPHGVIPFYAVNKLGGVCSMIHPLSPPPQIKMYLEISNSTFALTLDAFGKQFQEAIPGTKVKTLILAQIQDYLQGVMKLGFLLLKKRQVPKVPEGLEYVKYMDILNGNHPTVQKAEVKPNDMACILYSGGTTGIPKGIMLSNLNLIAEGMQVCAMGELNHTQSVLAILPIFHGFGLGVCVNAAFMVGGKSILVPLFTPETVAKLIKKKRPNFIIGVPTLFEALATNPVFQKTDLSCIEKAYCGADSLPRKTKEAFEAVVRKNNGNVTLNEGYGLTEAVTAIMAMPPNPAYYKENSIGIPFPDMLAKICKIGTTDEVPIGDEGEICIAGPAVMLGYLNHPEETAKTLQKHADGRIWLHTGDIGYMDTDGYSYFKLREKRMLKVSGVNVYPAQVEETVRKHPLVDQACVVGIPDKTQMTRVKVFVILKDPSKESDAVKEEILNFCRSELLKWEAPREVEFRKELPKTLVGKIAWKELENQELEKLKAAKQYPFDQ
jgi:long-chain acyl-CoA synthetase